MLKFEENVFPTANLQKMMNEMAWINYTTEQFHTIKHNLS